MIIDIHDTLKIPIQGYLLFDSKRLLYFFLKKNWVVIPEVYVFKSNYYIDKKKCLIYIFFVSS